MPDGMDVVELPAHDYLVFQGPAIADAEMGQAISQVWQSAEEFDPERLGWKWSETAPSYQLAPMAKRGYIEGRSVC